MTWTNAAKYYGLRAPYNFRVAIPFLLGAIGLISILLICVVLFAEGALTTGSVRFYFYLYITVLLLISVALSRLTILSVVILTWSLLELSLAILSAGLSPQNYFAGSSDFGFAYHPLLHIVPKPNWHKTARFDIRNKDYLERAGLYMNWSVVDGKEFKFSHNSLGLRGPELAADDLNKEIVFVYGGSTTYDVGVSDGETWVERLRSELNSKLTIVNFGVPWYSTTEHVIQTAFYQNIINKKPICAIYYVGWNDIGKIYVEQPDSTYADSSVLIMSIRKQPLLFARYSPSIGLLNKVMTSRFDTVPQLSKKYYDKPVPGSFERLKEIFVEHVNTIKAINDSRGIKTIFIGQILNRDMGREYPSGIAPLGDPPLPELWPVQERFNSILKHAAELNGSKYIDAGIDNFEIDDFVDQGHFAASGSRKFARLIAQRVSTYCN